MIKKKDINNLNYGFWKRTVSKEKELEQFLNRGRKRQLELIIATLEQMKRNEPELYKECKGKQWLSKFKKKVKNKED